MTLRKTLNFKIPLISFSRLKIIKKSIFKVKLIINNLSMIFSLMIKVNHKRINLKRLLISCQLIALIIIKTINSLLIRFKQ